MKIRNRLRITYTLMILIPIILIMITGGAIRHIYTDGSRHMIPPGSQRIFFSGGAIITISVVILILTNSLLSWYMSKRIINPLKVLEKAARQIKDEELDSPVTYRGDDEFDDVCRAFEEMRLRLKDSMEQQLKYEENRKELLANISHDLKTPITAIKGYMEGIRDGIADTPEKIERYNETIYGKAVLMNELIDRLFLFSKLDLGKVSFHIRPIELTSFLKDICDELSFDYPQLTLELDSEENLTVKGDPPHLQRVIGNLVDNACKYANREDPGVKIQIRRESGFARVTVRDNGPGVDSDSLDRLFERFYRGDPSRSSDREGSGLGLAISKQIIEAHGGSIVAQNGASEGLMIDFTLRLDHEENSHS